MANSLPKAFNPLNYLHFADNLASSETRSELFYRTAVNRAYYALFLIAREKIAVYQSTETHQAVIDWLRDNGYKNCSDLLSSMRRLRTVADYELVPNNPVHYNWKTNWEKQRAHAGKLLPVIQNLTT